MTPPIFVVSTGRTGTTFLAEAIRELGAHTAHEPGPRWLRLASNAYVSGAISHERAMRIVSRRRPAASTWDVEASCLVYGLTRPILDAKPEARVVHLVRDPRTYVRSAMNWGVHRLAGRPLNLIPYRRLAVPHLAGRTPRTLLDWAGRGQFSRVCWTWRALNEAITEQGEGHERFFTIRMEDLFDASTGYGGFVKILELAELPVPPADDLRRVLSQKVNPAHREIFPSWQHWSTAQLEQLVEDCADLAEHYGYPIKTEIGDLLDRRSSPEVRGSTHPSADPP